MDGKEMGIPGLLLALVFFVSTRPMRERRNSIHALGDDP